MEKFFNPSAYKSYEDLPEDQKENFKPVDGKESSFVKESAVDDFEIAWEEAEKITFAKTIEMNYVAGDASIETGVPNSRVHTSDSGHEYVGGGRVVRGGFGTYVVAYPSRYELVIEAGDKTRHGIWMERDFRLALGVKRLTEKVRDALEQTMPSTISVHELKSKRGYRYYRMDQDDILDWAEKSKKYRSEESQKSAVAKRLEKKNEKARQKVLDAECLQELFDSEFAVLCLRVDDLGLSDELAETLSFNDIIYIGQLVQKTETELKKDHDSFGARFIKEMRPVLERNGLSFNMDMPETIRKGLDVFLSEKVQADE